MISSGLPNGITVTVSAISNNGSVKEYATKLEKCLQAVSHQRMATPKWDVVCEMTLHPNIFLHIL